MRILFLGLVMLFSISVIAQNEYERERVIQAPGKSVEDIYKSLKTWFVENAKYDSRNILQIDNKADGELVGKASVQIEFKNLTWNALSGTITFVVDIKMKENRFKVRLYQFSHQRNDLTLSSSWDQGIIYKEIPADRKSGVKWKAYRTLSEKALPMLNTWCEDTFATMEKKVNSAVTKDDDNW